MAALENVIEKLRLYGIGRRDLDNNLFNNDKPPPRLAIYDIDDENLCHEVVITSCNIPGCEFTAESLIEFEDHYNSCHRYSCAQCKKMLPSAHFLDLHLQETHDSFFSVMAERKPSYCCYLDECKEKFMTADDRHNHCVKVHKLPRDFRFEHMVKSRKKAKNSASPMDLDEENAKEKKVIFFNNKQKTFYPKYTGRKFTNNSKEKTKASAINNNMDIAIDDLKESLPE